MCEYVGNDEHFGNSRRPTWDLLYSPSGVRLTDSTVPCSIFALLPRNLSLIRIPLQKLSRQMTRTGGRKREKGPQRRQRPSMSWSFCAPLCGLRTTLAKSVICAMVMAFHGTFCGDTEALTPRVFNPIVSKQRRKRHV